MKHCIILFLKYRQNSIFLLLVLGLTSVNGFSQGWSTFTGGTGSVQEHLYDIETDDTGNVYVCGYSNDSFGSAIRAYTSGEEAFVAKYNSNGVQQWLTFLGAGGTDNAYSISLDDTGNVYVAGQSDSSWGSPVTANTKSKDIWCCKLSNAGSLKWNTFLGGTDADGNGNDIVVSDSGFVYVTGLSRSAWGSPVRAYSSSHDAWVAKLTNSGSLVWHTFLGGAERQNGRALAVDTAGNVFVVGESYATWGSPLQSYSGDWDVYAAKLNASGVLQWHLFMGQSGQDDVGDFGNCMVLDDSANMYITGYGNGSWGSPIVSPAGAFDGWIVKVKSNGTIVWNTFVGGGGSTEQSNDIARGKSGNLYLTGFSNFTWGSPKNSFSSNLDGWVAKFRSNGTFLWNTFVGGTANDLCFSIALDTNDKIHLCGSSTGSWGSPVTSYGNNFDAFVVQLDSSGALPVELIAFEGKVNVLDQVELKWSTAQEINNAHFEVQRSPGQVQWVGIDTVNGYGTSYQILDYQSVDKFPNEGPNYYRLKQVDFDGTSTYHKTISVNVNRTYGSFVIYPNPANYEINLEFFSNHYKGGYTARLLSTTGVTMFEEKGTRSKMTMDVTEMVTGSYIIEVMLATGENIGNLKIQIN